MSDTDTLNYKSVGPFLYDHLKLHLANYDPYEYLPKQDREKFKKTMDSLKNSPRKDVSIVWDNALSKKQVSKNLHTALKEFDSQFKRIAASELSQAEMDNWFKDQLSKSEGDKSLTYQEKSFTLRYQSILRYAIKAFYESLPQPVSIAGGRMASSNCTVQQVNCYAGNISTYSGIGALFSSGVGGIVGAIVGTGVSIATCSCDNEECTYPRYISTPDVCYNATRGLDFVVAGYGNTSNGFEWEVYKSDNMIPANLLVKRASGPSINISNAELPGNTAVYVRALINCDEGTLLTPPRLLMINLPALGIPQFIMTGNTNAYTTAWEGYNLVGRNIQNTIWHIYTYGPASGSFISQSSASAVVQWNSTPGYIRLAAEATTSCGYYTEGLYIITRNY